MDYSKLKTANDHFEAYAALSSGQGFGIPAAGKRMMQQHAAAMKKGLDASGQRAAYNKIKSHANDLYENDEISDSDRNFIHKTYAPSIVKEDTDMELDEKKMTPAEMAKREKIVKSMKPGFAGFKERYGKRAKEVMYATATKQAMKSEEVVAEDQHYCAKHVYSEVFGEGLVVEGQHAQPDENGNVEWYTVQFEHGEEVVFTEDLEIMMAEYHNNHSMPKKKTKKKE